MNNNSEHRWDETFVEQKVAYTLQMGGKFFIVENVPARVCVETGEQFFAPDIVEQLQSIISEHRTPARMIETPVFEFAK